MSQPVAVIPVNRLDRAKGRLATILDGAERSRLAAITLQGVAAAAHDAGLAVRVVTPEPGALDGLLPPGVEVVREAPELAGLNAQLTRALVGLVDALVLHADLPLATPAAVRAVVDATAITPSVTVVESPDGGTNAMLLRPASAIPLAYGPGSFAAHRAGAAEAGIAIAVAVVPELALDLDTPGDLATLLASAAGRASTAGQYLLGLGVEARLSAVR